MLASFNFADTHSTFSFQLALVNRGVIDAACDNIFAGEVRDGVGRTCTSTYRV